MNHLAVEGGNAKKYCCAGALEIIEGKLGGRPFRLHDDRRAHPKREGHAAAEAEGEEQLARAENNIVGFNSRDLASVSFAGHDHVPMNMNDALRVASRAGGIEPEAIRHRGRRRRVEVW